MAKWEWGLTVRDSNVVEVTQVQEKWDGTGAQNEQEATGRGGGGALKREALAQDAQEADRWYALTPDNNQVQDFGGKGVTLILHLCPGPTATNSEWLTKEEAKGPCCILVDTSSLSV